MNIDDMILVSVDDHVVEPPDVFERHLPAKYRDIAPHVEHEARRHRRVALPRLRDPQRRPQRGRRPAARGVRHRPHVFDELRPGCYDVNRARARHERERAARLAQLPVASRFRGPALRGDDRQGRRARTEPGLQRLAHRRLVRCGARPLHPARGPPDLGSRRARRRGAPRREEGLPAITFPENPVPLGLPSLHDDHWDPVWRACADEDTVVCMHIGSSSQLVITAPDAPIDVMIVLQPMNIVQAAADLIHSPVFKKYPDLTVALSEGGIGWIPYFLERLDHSYLTHKAWTGSDFGTTSPHICRDYGCAKDHGPERCHDSSRQASINSREPTSH